MAEYSTGASAYIGRTFENRPVFFSPITQIYNRNPPTTLFTGSPGSGKTYGCSLVIMNSVMSGIQTAVIDGKGDLLSLTNFKDEIDDLTVWNLTGDGQAGLLDPFYLVDSPGEKIALARSVIEMLIAGGITKDEEAILNPLLKDLVASRQASLMRVVQELRRDRDKTARNLGSRLDAMSHMEGGRLCFAPYSEKRGVKNLAKNLTIITFPGLSLPSPDDKNRDDASRMAEVLIFLITYLIKRRLLSDPTNKYPKLLVIDEAWQVVGNANGAKLVEEIALLGRSMNSALILATQNNTHLAKLDVENTIATRFAFRCAQNEAETAVKSLGLAEGEGFEELFTSVLTTGDAIMLDSSKRHSLIRFETFRQEYGDKLASNPKQEILQEVVI